MWGAIIGDMAGSCFEFDNIRTKNFDLLATEATPGRGRISFPTDDSIMTVAVADALMQTVPTENTPDFAKYMRQWGLKYPNAGYGGMFWDWLQSPDNGPYGSWGNGAVMRVSPVALLAESDSEAIRLALESASVSHNHINAMHGAVATVMAIRAGWRGLRHEAFRTYMQDVFKYNLEISLAELNTQSYFDVSAGGTVRNALVCVLEASDFEDAVKNAVALGGDCDTTAAVAGAIAETMFGIPEPIMVKARSILHDELADIIDSMYLSESSNKRQQFIATMDIEEAVPTWSDFELATADGKALLGLKKWQSLLQLSETPIVKKDKQLEILRPGMCTALSYASLQDLPKNDAAMWVIVFGDPAFPLSDFKHVLHIQCNDTDDRSLRPWERWLADSDWPPGRILSILNCSLAKRARLSQFPERPPLREDARQILDFLKRMHQDAQSYLVAVCEYGRSRSVAVCRYDSLCYKTVFNSERDGNARLLRLLQEENAKHKPR